MTRSVSDVLSGHIASVCWDDLPDAARDGAKRVLLDAVGVIHAASGLAREASPFIALARANGEGPCTILGSGYSVQPLGAALANGALAHAVDYEDAFDLAPAHPNASLVPVLVALAQSEGDVDGQRFLTALAVGGDVACRIALSLRQPMEEGGWYPPPIVAAYGAVAGAASLLRLTPEQTRDALSLALCQVTMPGEIKNSRRTVLRAVREAFPAQAALTAALLAQEGVAGFEQPLEGSAGLFALFAGGRFAAHDLTDRLGEHYWGAELTFKPWPSCRGTHPFIEMALDLMSRHAFAAADIAEITVAVDDLQAMLVEPAERKRKPETAIDAKFSIPFTVALAFLHGAVRLDSFGPGSLSDPRVLSLCARVIAGVQPLPRWQRGAGGAMQVTLKDGTVHQSFAADALGCPARPLTHEAQLAKFVDCLSRAARPVSRSAAMALARRILTAETESDIGALLR